MARALNNNDYLDFLSQKYAQLHRVYENLYWKVYMGDESCAPKMQAALIKRDAFRGNKKLYQAVKDRLDTATAAEKKRLHKWMAFFELCQTPEEVLSLRKEISDLEERIRDKRTNSQQGYIDPKTGNFVKVSALTVSTLMRTHDDEAVRKACFEAQEKFAQLCLDDYVRLVDLRNQYARALGHEDFYAYKLHIGEKLTKQELFKIFDDIYNEVSYGYFETLKTKAKQQKGLLQPWNKSYYLAGDFTKQADPYLQFDQAIDRWGRSFAAMGVDFKGATLRLDLVDRPGKSANGFCHWPNIVHYVDEVRKAGSANFTANVVLGQPGAGARSLETLFHEAGHAAHLTNAESRESVYNNEYPPAVSAWAEVQSMFMDTICSSMPWRSRYALNEKGEAYPFALYEKRVNQLSFMAPAGIFSIMTISYFEKWIYESKNLNASKVARLAHKATAKFSPADTKYAWPLLAMHIYEWEPACSYHSYGLADIAVYQWRDYFYKKYEHIVDNPKVYQEMRQVWKLGAEKSFGEFITMATGQKFSAKSYIKLLKKTPKQIIRQAKQRLKKLESVARHTKPVKLNAKILLVDGKKTIATNKDGFEVMAAKYAKWIKKQTKDKQE